MFWSPGPIFLVPPGGSKLIGTVVLFHCEGQLLCGLGLLAWFCRDMDFLGCSPSY